MTNNPTLRHILHRFNFDRDGDYSQGVMPINLFMNRTGLASLFADLGFTVGAEIGTAAGDYAETLCKANPNLKLYCVDKWQPYHGYTDHTHKTTLDGFFEQTKERLADYLWRQISPIIPPADGSLPIASYPDRDGEQRALVHLVRAWSLDAAKCFKDTSLDFVYIDANHRYEYVVADIAAWLPKIRSGGIISGHDYNQSRQSRKKLFGVVEAVQGWTSAYNVSPWFVCKGEWSSVGDKTPSWFWVKE